MEFVFLDLLLFSHYESDSAWLVSFYTGLYPVPNVFWSNIDLNKCEHIALSFAYRDAAQFLAASQIMDGDSTWTNNSDIAFFICAQTFIRTLLCYALTPAPKHI